MRFGPATLVAALTLPGASTAQSAPLAQVDSLTATGSIQLARETLQQW